MPVSRSILSLYVLYYYTFSFLASDDCLLTVAITAFHTPIPMDSVKDIHPENCRVEYIYWVTELTYDRSILESDKTKSIPFIVRSNVEEDGYLSFILPLLYNSTYSLIIDAQDLYSLPSSNWIDKAILAIQANHSLIPVCGLYPNSQVGRGCMLMRSIDLRYIWSMTSFRRKSVRAMEAFSHMLRCKWHYTITDSILLPIRFHRTSYTPSAYVKENCEKVYDIKDFTCNTNYKKDGTTGVVLSQFKRTWLDDQMKSLNQSDTRVSQVIVLQDAQFQNYESTLKKWSIAHHVWTTNWDSPFFLRFLMPLELTTYYIHLIDDDIVLGRTCLSSMNRISSKHDAAVSVCGRIVKSLGYSEVGFKQSVASSLQRDGLPVDFLCQTYGAQMEHMKVFWRYRPVTQRNGEDIHFSLSNKMECSRSLRVLPLLRKTDLFLNHGADSVAISKTSSHFPLRALILRSWFYRGVHLKNEKTLRRGYPKGYREYVKGFSYETSYYFALGVWFGYNLVRDGSIQLRGFESQHCTVK